MTEFYVLVREVATVRQTLEDLLNEVRTTRLWRARGHLQGAVGLSMLRVEGGVANIETLVSTLGWDHAALLIGTHVQPIVPVISSGTEAAIRNRVKVATEFSEWLNDYLAWAACWEQDGGDETGVRTLH